MNYALATTLWKHKVPIVLGLAGGSLVAKQLISLVVPLSTQFENVWLGIALGCMYLLLAGFYEWTIRAYERTQERLQRKRELIEDMDFEETGQS